MTTTPPQATTATTPQPDTPLFVPAFPPKGFTFDDVRQLNNMVAKSELEEMRKIREILKPHLISIPRQYKTLSERVAYLVNREK